MNHEALGELAAQAGPVSLMEICGTHTVSLFRSGLRSLLPPSVKLVSGPGCPVCVTPQGYLDAAVALAQGGVTIATYGDLVRVPGQRGSLERARAAGAKVAICYSVRDALRYAEAHPTEDVVFLAVGFETTAPATALAVRHALRHRLTRFSLLMGHKRVMPALDALLATPHHLSGLLLPGHVSAIIGTEPYRPLVARHGLACAVAGFEPSQLVLGLTSLLEQRVAGQPRLDNVYPVAVAPQGNPQALALLDEVFQPQDALWRALGVIPASSLALRPSFTELDAARRYGLDIDVDVEPPGCRCGEVIQGKAEPPDCPLFGAGCTPQDPIGPCMVSSEGTCAAWHRYGELTRGRP